MWWRTAARPEIEAALARVPIFSSLTSRDMHRLAAMCLLKHYTTGDSILEEGSTGLGLFVLVSGRVEVFKRQGDQRISLAVLTDGDVLGEMALLDDQPRSASAVALASTECLLLSRDRFRLLVKRRPPVAWPIVPALALRIRDLQQRLLAAENSAQHDADPAKHAVGERPENPAADTPGDEEEPVTVGRPLETGASPNGRRQLSDRSVNLLRTPYALLMTGTDSLDESVRLIEVFLQSLDESAGISRGRPVKELVRDLPTSFLNAGLSSWGEGLKVPSRILRGFRRRLRPDLGNRP